ncbi:hypothetical protein PMI40_00343 [Herbaspirillum sp. YR522]|nr:hypothetical protein PMI40_00343 [Herbaspirillum sp. YR522]
MPVSPLHSYSPTSSGSSADEEITSPSLRHAEDHRSPTMTWEEFINPHPGDGPGPLNNPRAGQGWRSRLVEHFNFAFDNVAAIPDYFRTVNAPEHFARLPRDLRLLCQKVHEHHPDSLTWLDAFARSQGYRHFGFYCETGFNLTLRAHDVLRLREQLNALDDFRNARQPEPALSPGLSVGVATPMMIWAVIVVVGLMNARSALNLLMKEKGDDQQFKAFVALARDLTAMVVHLNFAVRQAPTVWSLPIKDRNHLIEPPLDPVSNPDAHLQAELQVRKDRDEGLRRICQQDIPDLIISFLLQSAASSELRKYMA